MNDFGAKEPTALWKKGFGLLSHLDTFEMFTHDINLLIQISVTLNKIRSQALDTFGAPLGVLTNF